jgi:hypothetical protein
MSVALLTNSSSVPVSLNPNLFFSSLRGTTLTLDTLNVGTIRAGQVLLGDDALPDIYMFGQVPSLKILGFPPNDIVGPGTYPTAGVTPMNLPNSTGANNADSIATGYGQNITSQLGLNDPTQVIFPEVIHYTPATQGDPLNPYVSASIIQSCSSIQGVPSATIVRMGITSLSPTVLLLQTPSKTTATGAFFLLPIPVKGNLGGAGAFSIAQMFGQTQGGVSNLPPLQMCWFVAGSPPSTPPSAWRGGAVNPAGTITTTFTPVVPAPATPIACSQWVYDFTGGIVGSSVLFPSQALSTTGWSVVGDNTDDNTRYPLVAFPCSSITDTSIFTRLRFNQYETNDVLLPEPPGGYLTTGGMWIQQIWWMANATSNAPAASFNLTALFTPKVIPGTGATALPLNYCKLEVSPRGPAPPSGDPTDGAFSVRISMPRVVNTPTTGATGQVIWTSDAFMREFPSDSQSPPSPTFNAVQGNGYWIIILACLSQDTSITAVRSSDGIVPPLGQASTTVPFDSNKGTNPNQYLSGQFSIYPPGYTGAAPTNSVQPAGAPPQFASANGRWTSVPNGPNAGAWYTGAPNLGGQLVLVPPP